MLKKKMIALAAVAALALSSVSATAQVRPPLHGGVAGSAGGVVYGIIGCAGLIIIASISANQNQQRELTTEEALSCGLLYFLDPEKPVNKRRR